MTTQFMGYTFHKLTEFRPNATLISRENQTITVSMAQEAVEYMISVISKINPRIGRYSVALKVLWAIRVRLANGQPREPHKKDFKIACDVLAEIQKEYATTEEQKSRIDEAASLCKVLIEWRMRD